MCDFRTAFPQIPSTLIIFYFILFHVLCFSMDNWRVLKTNQGHRNCRSLGNCFTQKSWEKSDAAGSVWTTCLVLWRQVTTTSGSCLLYQVLLLLRPHTMRVWEREKKYRKYVYYIWKNKDMKNCDATCGLSSHGLSIFYLPSHWTAAKSSKPTLKCISAQHILNAVALKRHIMLWIRRIIIHDEVTLSKRESIICSRA